MRSIQIRTCIIVCCLFMFLSPAAEIGKGITAKRAQFDTSNAPNIILIAVDTLRSDHLSGMGYHRQTSPAIDKILRGGARWDNARTVEPLTNPAMCSILTSRMPHQHGASRNGLKIREGLSSLPKSLHDAGYRTSAFVGNWTLRDKISGLAEHFDTYGEIFNKKRWFGLFASEATAEDLVDETVTWVKTHSKTNPNQPFFTWVHFVEPHAPYIDHKEFHKQLGLENHNSLHAKDRYDTEIAFVDKAIKRLLDQLKPITQAKETLIIFVSDHGESLGEHNYWGHGRNLHEPNLKIPMAIQWTGKIKHKPIKTVSSNIDLAPTVLGLLGIEIPLEFEGYDWSPILLSDIAEPNGRKTYHQAHKGAVVGRSKSALARRSGLLSLAMVSEDTKEIFRVDKQKHYVFNLKTDPQERKPLTPSDTSAEAPILSWMRTVFDGLAESDEVPVKPLDQESIDALKSLGYVD